MRVMNRREYDALTRLHFAVFLRRVFAELNPGVDYLDNFHVHVIIESLERMRAGNNPRLAVAMPPRSLKSIIISVAWVAWLLGKDPALKIISVSYGQDLADKLASDCRQVMQSAWYRALFPRTRLRAGRQSLALFETTAGGGRFSTSVTGALTGFGADWIILDDPMKPTEALSEAERTSSNHSIQHTLFTRLNDKKKGRILIVMQRLHEDDLIGSLQERAPGTFKLLSFPAIAGDDEVHEYQTPWGRRVHHRTAGEALHPEREPVEVLEQQRKLLGTLYFSAQYLQAPVAAEGNLVKFAWFRHYSPFEIAAPERIIQSWDTASKTGVLNDYSVCTTWALKGQRIYLVDVLRERLEFPVLKRRVIEEADRYNAQIVLIEDKASGTALLQDLQASGFWKGRAVQAVSDKISRIAGVTAMIERGEVLIPQSAPWLDTYIAELCAFPNAKHDDQVDSTSQALAWIRQEGSPGGLFDFYRQEYERRAAFSEHRTVQLRAPHGMAHVLMRDGERRNIGPDGILWVAEADAGPLMAANFVRVMP